MLQDLLKYLFYWILDLKLKVFRELYKNQNEFSLGHSRGDFYYSPNPVWDRIKNCGGRIRIYNLNSALTFRLFGIKYKKGVFYGKS